MQIVHFTSKTVGSFDWELPQDLADRISQLPKELQPIVLKQLEKNIQAFLHTLLGAMFMGPFIQTALDLINTKQIELSQQLIEICDKAEKNR